MKLINNVYAVHRSLFSRHIDTDFKVNYRDKKEKQKLPSQDYPRLQNPSQVAQPEIDHRYYDFFLTRVGVEIRGGISEDEFVIRKSFSS